MFVKNLRQYHLLWLLKPVLDHYHCELVSYIVSVHMCNQSDNSQSSQFDRNNTGLLDNNNQDL
jgi:hypothetical protein